MVGLVIVSHSPTLAEGVVELARQMGGADLTIEAAGGMADPPGEIGTDAELVRQAIERAAGPDGVLVLMDLGSAVMSAEMAVEMIAMESDARVVLSDAPLVEGAVAAAARAGAGASLDEVAQEARAALAMKAGQLGTEADAGAAAPEAAPEAAEGPPPDAEARLEVLNRLGLHARPAARIVEAVGGFDAHVTVSDTTTGRGPVDARSLSGIVTLGVRQGHELTVAARGPDAQAAVEALRRLAEEGYGDGVAPGAVTGGETLAPPAAEAPEPVPAEPPPAGARLRGVPVSPGLGIGLARVLAPLDAVPEGAPGGDPAEEERRLDEALAGARRDLEAARQRIAARGHRAEAAIFDAHLSLLDDPAMLGRVRDAIRTGDAAGAAWASVVRSVAADFRALDDAVLRERAVDVEDVGGRVLRHLEGAAPEDEGAAEAGVLVARDLTPGDAAALDPAVVAGIALARGGATSHAAILARALGIPTVAGLGDALLRLPPATPLVLDGDAGTLDVAPDEDVVEERRRAAGAAEERRRRARARASEPATTADGTHIVVHANAGTVQDARAAVQHGADGIGLLRTEFLFIDRPDAPGEEEQREAYAEIARALEGRPLTIRTLDAGADKPLGFVPQAPEDNPFLGVRGIRLALVHPELLATQLRAIVAVAAEHPVRVMFPMVTTVAEFRAARRALDEARAAVGAPELPVGAMVEVPALPLAAGRFAAVADFFSVGTNDLTQYTVAAERGNPGVAALMAGPAPAVLRLVAMLTESAGAAGRSVGVCGELAGDPAAAVLLAGLGVRSLSVAAPRVPEIKQTLRDVSLEQAREVARGALDAEDAAEAADLVHPLLT